MNALTTRIWSERLAGHPQPIGSIASDASIAFHECVPPILNDVRWTPTVSITAISARRGSVTIQFEGLPSRLCV